MMIEFKLTLIVLVFGDQCLIKFYMLKFCKISSCRIVSLLARVSLGFSGK